MKKRLLYVSPFPPHKSGIADYSDNLIEYLSEHYEVSLLVDQMQLINQSLYDTTTRELYRSLNPDLFSRYPFYVFGADSIPFQDFDHIIYNIGNNPHFHNFMYELALKHPGMIILHDYILFYLTVGHYLQSKWLFWKKMYQIGGWEAIWLFIDLTFNLKNFLHTPSHRLVPLNKEILESKNIFMVHSQYSKNQILSRLPSLASKIKVVHMLLHRSISKKRLSPIEIRRKFSLPENSLVISSFGFIAETKLNHLICEAVLELKKDFPEIIYVMAGEGHYVDKYVDQKAIFKTGYVNIDEFTSLISASEIVANLRFPSMGETSSSMIRVLGEGKACLVSNDAWFSELPNDVTLKINNDNQAIEIVEKLRFLLENPTERKNLGERAKNYIQSEYHGTKIALQIKEWLESKPS